MVEGITEISLMPLRITVLMPLREGTSKREREAGHARKGRTEIKQCYNNSLGDPEPLWVLVLLGLTLPHLDTAATIAAKGMNSVA